MQPYSEFRPTQFDSKGLALDDCQDWLVVPVSRTRDSGELAESNFETALEMLGGEGENVEVHRFGHWGPGWFEIIIVKPNTKEATIAEGIEASLENYPVLNDEDFSNREFEAYQESWQNWARREFCQALRGKFGLSDIAYNFLDDIDGDTLGEFFQECNTSGDWYYSEDSGVCVNVKASVHHCTRQNLAQFMRKQGCFLYKPATA